MDTISDLYFQTKRLHDERVAWQLKNPPNGTVMREVEQLKKIMDGLVNAFKLAGGTKVAEHEHVEGTPPHCRTTPPVGWEHITIKQLQE